MSSEERASLLAAFRRTAAEQGCRGLTVEAIARAAGLPRERFDAHFQTLEEALIAAQAEFLERLHRQAGRSSRAVPEWPDKVRAELDSVLDAFVEAEGLARAFAVEAPGESFVAAQRQFEAIGQFAAQLRAGRRHYPDSASLPEVAERVLVGGVASIVTEHLFTEDMLALRALEPQLLELLLAPYLGAGQARRFAAG